jgi:hypothetical protein
MANELRGVSPQTDQVGRDIRQLADGRFRPRHADLRDALVKRLAAIDQDHISRGLYNCSVRFNVRCVTCIETLREILELRVKSVMDAYEIADTPLDTAGRTLLREEIFRLGVEAATMLQKDAESESAKSLGNQFLQAMLGAIGRSIGVEKGRAQELIQTEVARQSLLRTRRTEVSPADAAIAAHAARLAARASVTKEVVQESEPGQDEPLARTQAVTPVVEAANAPLAFGGGVLSMELVNTDMPTRTAVWITYRAPTGEAKKVVINGRTQAHLIKLVIERPDFDHAWTDLVRTGNAAGYWQHSSPRSLKRTGQRIRRELPATLRGHWNQSETRVSWQSQ